MDRSRFGAVAYSAAALFDTESLLQSKENYLHLKYKSFESIFIVQHIL